MPLLYGDNFGSHQARYPLWMAGKLDRVVAVFKKYQEKEMDFAVDCRAVRFPRALMTAHGCGVGHPAALANQRENL
jgi:hypothetical protein